MPRGGNAWTGVTYEALYGPPPGSRTATDTRPVRVPPTKIPVRLNVGIPPQSVPTPSRGTGPSTPQTPPPGPRTRTPQQTATPTGPGSPPPPRSPGGLPIAPTLNEYSTPPPFWRNARKVDPTPAPTPTRDQGGRPEWLDKLEAAEKPREWKRNPADRINDKLSPANQVTFASARGSALLKWAKRTMILGVCIASGGAAVPFVLGYYAGKKITKVAINHSEKRRQATVRALQEEGRQYDRENGTDYMRQRGQGRETAREQGQSRTSQDRDTTTQYRSRETGRETGQRETSRPQQSPLRETISEELVAAKLKIVELESKLSVAELKAEVAELRGEVKALREVLQHPRQWNEQRHQNEQRYQNGNVRDENATARHAAREPQPEQAQAGPERAQTGPEQTQARTQSSPAVEATGPAAPLTPRQQQAERYAGVILAAAGKADPSIARAAQKMEFTQGTNMIAGQGLPVGDAKLSNVDKLNKLMSSDPQFGGHREQIVKALGEAQQRTADPREAGELQTAINFAGREREGVAGTSEAFNHTGKSFAADVKSAGESFAQQNPSQVHARSQADDLGQSVA